jgi:hypothetical protein
MKQNSHVNQIASPEYLYSVLLLALWNKLCKSKKHKAFYLFSVFFSDAYWLKDIVPIVRDAVENNTLHLVRENCDPADKYEDSILVYFLEDGTKQFFIVLVYKSLQKPDEDSLVDIIPVTNNNYQMMQIYPDPTQPRFRDIIRKSDSRIV